MVEIEHQYTNKLHYMTITFKMETFPTESFFKLSDPWSVKSSPFSSIFLSIFVDMLSTWPRRGECWLFSFHSIGDRNNFSNYLLLDNSNLLQYCSDIWTCRCTIWTCRCIIWTCRCTIWTCRCTIWTCRCTINTWPRRGWCWIAPYSMGNGHNSSQLQ